MPAALFIVHVKLIVCNMYHATLSTHGSPILRRRQHTEMVGFIGRSNVVLIQTYRSTKNTTWYDYCITVLLYDGNDGNAE